MNEEAMKKVRKKRQAYQRYLETREGKDYIAYTKARNQVKWNCKRAMRDFENKYPEKQRQTQRLSMHMPRAK